MENTVPAVAESACPRCGKLPPLCVCATIEPLDNRIEVVILQHPQEQDEALGTARLTLLHLKRAKLRIGLSWASLAKLLGRPVDARRWAVLYLGSAHAGKLPPGREVVLLDRKGAAVGAQDAALAEIEGIVVLDGSWSQAKALWWRNPWMLKCRRVVLAPHHPSRYGKLRREPRREGLSTLEATALLLSRLEAKPEIERALVASFEALLQRYRAGRRPQDQRPSAAKSGPSSAA
ncbi:MAG TPA: tRNA-uridine aminocarboxypropyltransferase [Stellaceae bacterium]|nr:tRNA-uridine aminocarboxypropyltransferase [Stellaceae bacterium]